jgi:hypothetical protein
MTRLLLTPLIAMVAFVVVRSPTDARTTHASSPVAHSSTSINPARSNVEQQAKSATYLAANNVDLSSWRKDGRASNVRTTDGKPTYVAPLRGDALSTTPAGVTPKWCGARFQSGAEPAQSLVLVGVGITEALSCTRIKAFGAVPAPRGVERIAFIYVGSSPNASGVTTVVIVDKILASASNGWQVNDELSYKLDQRGNLTSIPAIRAYLAKN